MIIRKVLNRYNTTFFPMPKKREKITLSQKHRTLLSALIFLVAVGLVLYIVGAIAQTIREQEQTSAVGAAIQIPPEKNVEAENKPPENSQTVQMMDFPNDQQGIFIGILQSEYFKQPVDQIVVLFASSRIPGLTIIYYPYEKRLVAGTPAMNAENIAFFDGTSHELKYAFQKDGNQQLWYDGKLVAESRFIPVRSTLTGAVIGVPEVLVSEGFKDVAIES